MTRYGDIFVNCN